MPVRPALAGAVAGVLGVLAAFTLSAGVCDAAAHPARFGQTWQLATFFGLNGQDLGPASRVLRAVAADRDVTGVDDARIGGAQSGQVSVESFTYAPVAGKRLPVVLTAGRMPGKPDEIALAPATARELRAVTGSIIRLTGGAATPRAVRVTGIAFVPAGPHNGYDDGAWLTPAGYDRIFAGARYAFKFHAAAVALRPGASVQAVARRLNAAAAAIKGGRAFPFTPPPALPEVQEIKDLELLPLALSAFLALLATGAAGHALSIAVNRRRHELAVLRAPGMTRRQTRMVVATQASVLAMTGLVFGIPLGPRPRPEHLARGRRLHAPGLSPAARRAGAAADRPHRPAGREHARRLAGPPCRTPAHRTGTPRRMISYRRAASGLPEMPAVTGQHKPGAVITGIRMPPTGRDEGIQAATAILVPAAALAPAGGAAAAGVPASAARPARPVIAYVANLGGNTVIPVNTVTDKAGKAIKVGPGPDGIAITPDGKTAYVANGGLPPAGSDTVTPIRIATSTALRPVRVGSGRGIGPDAIAITPDGKTAYVPSYSDGTVTPIRIATNTALKPIKTGSSPSPSRSPPTGRPPTSSTSARARSPRSGPPRTPP